MFFFISDSLFALANVFASIHIKHFYFRIHNGHLRGMTVLPDFCIRLCENFKN
jgi:hypothetical protein